MEYQQKLFGLESQVNGVAVKWISINGVLLVDGTLIPLIELEMML